MEKKKSNQIQNPPTNNMLLPHKITINKKLPNKIIILRTWLFDPAQKKPMKQKEK